VLLISRTESKLVAAAEEVAKKYNVQTKYTVVDFANADEATWQRTTTALASLDVGLLINNVGLSYDHCEYLEHLSDQDVRNMVEVNITSVNQVSSQTQKLRSTASFLQAILRDSITAGAEKHDCGTCKTSTF